MSITQTIQCEEYLPLTRIALERRPMAMWLRTTIILALAGIAVGATVYGFDLRRGAFNNNGHYGSDVSSGFGWGRIAIDNRVGLFNVYDLYAAGRISGPNEIDYAPLRLTVMTGWAKWASINLPGYRSWQVRYDLTWPILGVNTVAELLCSILVFLLIRLWIIRQDNADRPIGVPARAFRGCASGMIGAAIFWFNPAVIWDGHVFPQWDIWLAPFFLAAVLLGCVEWWFAAGVCIAIGTFLKAQILFVAPILVLWPLFQLRFDAILRLVSGFVLAAAGIAFLWLHLSTPALVWYLLMLTAMALVTPITLGRKLSVPWLVTITIVVIALAWPWKSQASPSQHTFALALIGLVCLARFLPSRLLPSVYALVVGVVVFLTIPLFDSHTAWYSIGFEFGTKKFSSMTSNSCYNVPMLLEQTFRWSSSTHTPVPLPFTDSTMEIRSFMLMIYGICLTLCSVGAAMNSRRNDTRFLMAMVAPWLCWFLVLLQLNNRYLVFASGLSALLPAVGLGPTILGIIVSIIGYAGISDYTGGPGNPTLARLFGTFEPHIAWLLLLIAAIFLYLAIAPQQRRRPA